MIKLQLYYFRYRLTFHRLNRDLFPVFSFLPHRHDLNTLVVMVLINDILE